jgi:hypothetical protein
MPKYGRAPTGRAFRSIFCSAKAPQKDAAAIPHAGLRHTEKMSSKRHIKYVNKKTIKHTIVGGSIVCTKLIL